MSDLALFAQRTTGWATSVWAASEKGNLKNERMSVSDPEEKIEWGADSEPRKNERVPSSAAYAKKYLAYTQRKLKILNFFTISANEAEGTLKRIKLTLSLR